MIFVCNNMSEFDSETSSVVLEVFEMVDLIESKWAHDSDPDIEQDFMDLIKDEELNNTFQMVRRVSEKLHTSASTSVGIAEEWDQKSFAEVGGPQMLRGVGSRLKDMLRIVGVKRNRQ